MTLRRRPKTADEGLTVNVGAGQGSKVTFWEIVLLALGLLLVASAVSPTVRKIVETQAKHALAWFVEKVGPWLGLGIAASAAGNAAGKAAVGAIKEKLSPKPTEEEQPKKKPPKKSKKTSNYDETMTRIKSLLHLEGVPSLEVQ
jgi:hypothetical protein